MRQETHLGMRRVRHHWMRVMRRAERRLWPVLRRWWKRSSSRVDGMSGGVMAGHGKQRSMAHAVGGVMLRQAVRVMRGSERGESGMRGMRGRRSRRLGWWCMLWLVDMSHGMHRSERMRTVMRILRRRMMMRGWREWVRIRMWCRNWLETMNWLDGGGSSAAHFRRR